MKRVMLALLLAVLALPMMLVAPAQAAAALDGKVVIGENYVLQSGDTLAGDLVVISGSAVVEEGAQVDGNVVGIGGRTDLAGSVQQNVTLLGGSLTLRRSAVVKGPLAVLGGSITREEGAQLEGGESQLGPGGKRDGGVVAPTPRAKLLDVGDLLFQFVQGTLLALMLVTFLSLLALVIAALWPDQTMRVSAAVAAAPAVSGLLGLLTLVAVPIVLGLVALTLCLAPISLLGLVAYMAMILFGWVALGQWLGSRLAGAFRWNLPPVGTATLGTLVITTIVALFLPFGPVACLSWTLATIFACIGLGGVVLTRFGMSPYVMAASSMPVPPVPPMAAMPPEPAPTPTPPPAPVPPEPPDITLFGREPEAPAASEPPAEPPAPPAEPPAA